MAIKSVRLLVKKGSNPSIFANDIYHVLMEDLHFIML